MFLRHRVRCTVRLLTLQSCIVRGSSVYVTLIGTLLAVQMPLCFHGLIPRCQRPGVPYLGGSARLGVVARLLSCSLSHAANESSATYGIESPRQPTVSQLA